MVSAEERKKRFLEAKAAAGGADQLMLQQKNKPYRLYFNDTGDIMCFTNDDGIHIQEGWETHDFTQPQLQILREKDLTRFRVKKDPKVDNLFSIELRPLETIFISADQDFLFEIKPHQKIENPDIKCSITKTQLVVTLSKTVKAEYKGVYPISATVNGSRLLKFYVTAENDPHDMYHYSVISLADLLANKQVKVDLDDDLRKYSVFTNKLFDTYVRI